MSFFRNTYLIMRHGQSEANATGVIVSSAEIGCRQFGLTALGAEQAERSAKLFADKAVSRVVCSDFLRTLETATIAAKTLNLAEPQIDEGLRERFFGCWDGQSHDHYESVWLRDAGHKDAVDDGVESTAAVLLRGIGVLKRLEESYQDETILLVSHGDMLQILRTAFVGIDSSEHRSLPHHETGEIRELVKQAVRYPLALQ